jgi:hypothetical protein
VLEDALNSCNTSIPNHHHCWQHPSDTDNKEPIP